MKKLLLFSLLFTTITFSQWQIKNGGLPIGTYGGCIDAVDQNNAVGSFNAGIYNTSNAGDSWTKISSERANDIAMTSADIIYAALARKIIKTTDRGTTWQTALQLASNIGDFNYIKVFQGVIIAMADCDLNDPASPAQFYKSTDEGVTWTQVNQNYLLGGWSGDLWHRLDFGSPQTGIFHCSGITPQHTLRTTDGGASWIDVGLSTILRQVKMYDQSYGLAVGVEYTSGVRTGFYMHITRNGGQTWESRPINIGSDGIRSIEFIPNNPANVFMSSMSGLFFSADSGKTWTHQNISSSTSRYEDIKFVDDNCGWLLCYDGHIYWTNNKGNAVVGTSKENKLPTQYSLSQNYPNPFNPSTNIKFALPEAGRVTIKIFDILGQEVKTLVESEMSAGQHSINWNSDNNSGQKVATGIYLYSIISNKFSQTKKMVLLK